MAKFHDTGFQPDLFEVLSRQIRARVVVATARLETAVTHKLSRPGPPRSAPGEPPHIDTGRLRQSVHSGTEQVGYILRGFVSVNIEYARLLEYGTLTIEPRPFAGPALAEEEANILAILAGPFKLRAF